MTQAAKKGDTVKVHYTGTLEDGSVFDTTEGREPITFELGSGSLIPGFEDAVMEMSVGDSKKIHIEAEDAFGPWIQENVIVVPKTNFEGDTNVEVGQRMMVSRNDGATITVVVLEIADDAITLDANHPLAGKCLDFDLQLVEILCG